VFIYPDCSEAYAPGAEVTLTASSPGRIFKGWGGACSGTGACTVTMDTAKSVSAEFGPLPPYPEITEAMINQAKDTARFKFHTAEGNATGFQCWLGRKHHTATGFITGCISPKTYRHLKAGKYTFKVRAIGRGGLNPLPATKTFKIRR
jgi:hypothetical protein